MFITFLVFFDDAIWFLHDAMSCLVRDVRRQIERRKAFIYAFLPSFALKELSGASEVVLLASPSSQS